MDDKLLYFLVKDKQKKLLEETERVLIRSAKSGVKRSFVKDQVLWRITPNDVDNTIKFEKKNVMYKLKLPSEETLESISNVEQEVLSCSSQSSDFTSSSVQVNSCRLQLNWVVSRSAVLFKNVGEDLEDDLKLAYN